MSLVQLYTVPVPVKGILTSVPEHSSRSVNGSTDAIGLTVIVKSSVGPIQPFNVAVTVMIELIGKFVPFVEINGKTDPVPEADNPVCVLLFVQVKALPGKLVKSTCTVC